jgi:hypothetical protein
MGMRTQHTSGMEPRRATFCLSMLVLLLPVVALAAPAVDVRFTLVDLPELTLGTPLEVLHCAAGRCTVRPVQQAQEGGTIDVAEEDLGPKKPTVESAARAADAALSRACASARCLVARAQLHTMLRDPRGARAFINEAVKRTLDDAGTGPRLVVSGEVPLPPSVRDGERVVALCPERVVRGRVSVRPQLGPNGWEFSVGVPCPAVGSARPRENAAQLIVAIAGLSGPLPTRGEFSTPYGDVDGAWTLGPQHLRLTHSTGFDWLIDDARGVRAAVPSPYANFVGDLDGDSRIDAVVVAGDWDQCRFGSAWLLLSSASPGTPLPVTVAQAQTPMGWCD